MWFVTGEGLGGFWKSFGGDSLAKGTPRATKPGRTTWAEQL